MSRRLNPKFRHWSIHIRRNNNTTYYCLLGHTNSACRSCAADDVFRPTSQPFIAQSDISLYVIIDLRGMNMSPKLRPLRLPLLVEERRKREEAQSEAGDDAPYRSYSLDSCSSDVPSPVTPTFSTRGHLRCSSSTSSFDLTPPTNLESPASPVPSAQLSSKRVLDDVQEEPHELEDFDNDDALSDQFDLCNCLSRFRYIRPVLH